MRQWIKIEADGSLLDDIAEKIESLNAGKIKYGEDNLKWYVMEGVAEERRSEVIKEVLKPFKNEITELSVQRRDADDKVRFKTIPTDCPLGHCINKIEEEIERNESEDPAKKIKDKVDALTGLGKGLGLFK